MKNVLRYLFDNVELFFPLSRAEAYKRAYTFTPSPDWENYFPSVVLRTADRLERRGMVEKIPSPGGMTIKITENGKKELLRYRLVDFKPKSGKWDGKWRVVFFDIPMKENPQRDKLRLYLRMLGMKMMQESVWVSPYDVSGEIRYIREILSVPDRVKLAVMSYLENSDELRQIFEV